MSTKVALVVFLVVFSLGILLIVLLPFFLGKGPALPRPDSPAESPAALQDQGVFRSDDGGRTWAAKSAAAASGGSVSTFRINRLIADPSDPATFYLATDGNGLWVSRNRGDEWVLVRDEKGVLEPRSNVLGLAVNPENPAEWYVAVFQKSRGRLLRTADQGRTFREIYFTPLERFGVFDVFYERGAVSIVTGQGGFLETRDQGKTWRVVRWFANGLVRLLVNPANPAVRFVTTPQGSIFRTENRGESWADITPAIRSFSGATRNQRWAVDRAGALYLGSDHGLLYSRDNGASFTRPPLIIPPDALPILAVAVDPRNRSRVVVSAANQLYGSEDDGTTWAILSSPGSKRITHLGIDRENSETVYAVVAP